MTARAADIAAWGALCLIAAWVMVYATAQGIGVSADSTVYIATARQLLHPLGLAPLLGSGAGIRLSSLGFGYVGALAASAVVLRMDPLDAARWLHVALLPLNLLLAGAVIRRALPGSRLAPIAGAALLAGAPNLLRIHAMAWSEPLFLTCTLATLYLLDRWVQERRPIWLAGCTTALAAACLTRYSGVVVVGTVVLVLLLRTQGPLLRRTTIAAGAGALAVLPMLVWSAVSPSFRRLAWHPQPLSWWTDGLVTVSSWAFPPPLALAPAGAVWAGVVLLALAVAVSATAWIARVREASVVDALSLVSVLHVSVLVVTAYFWDVTTDLDGRQLVTLQVTLVLLAVVGLAPLFRPPAGRTASVPGRGMSVARRSALGAAVWLLAAGISVFGAAPWALEMHSQSAGYTRREWRGSELMTALGRLPAGTWIVTNANDLVATYTPLNTRRLPDRLNPSTGRPEPEYATLLERLHADALSKSAFVAYFRSVGATRWYQTTEEELRTLWDLEVVGEFPEGALYRLKQPVPSGEAELLH